MTTFNVKAIYTTSNNKSNLEVSISGSQKYGGTRNATRIKSDFTNKELEPLKKELVALLEKYKEDIELNAAIAAAEALTVAVRLGEL